MSTRVVVVQTLVRRASRVIGEPIEIAPTRRVVTGVPMPMPLPSHKPKTTKAKSMQNTRFETSAAARRVALAEGAADGDAKKTIAKIAALLGVDDAGDRKAIVDALAALLDEGFASDDVAALARRHGISTREVRMCAAKGIDPAKYAATRRAGAAKSPNGWASLRGARG